MPTDDLADAAQAEQLGDAEGGGEAAIAHYCEALSLLLPPGTDGTTRESYDRLMVAFERIQQKIQRRIESLAPPSTTPALSVYKFSSGLTVRIVQAFIDFDGQEIHAGEILHLLATSYFPYEGGFTLKFAEKTIRLALIVDENQPIIENTGNAFFQPIL